jgi:hypothetical protein
MFNNRYLIKSLLFLAILLGLGIPASAQINLFNAVPATLAQTSRIVTNPLYAQNGTLIITWAGITGSPSGCQFQMVIVDSQGNTSSNGSPVAVAPANGTSTANFTGTPNYPKLQIAYTCTTYPTAGTLTLDYAPQQVITGGSSSFIAGQTPITAAIYAADPKYGLHNDSHFVIDATIAAGTGNVTTSASDPPFLSTDCVGGAGCTGTGTAKAAFGTNGLTGANTRIGDFVTLPEGVIISFTDAHHVTVSTTTTVCTGGCAFAWGHYDDAALNSAWSDAIAACIPLILPAGVMFVQTPHFNAQNTFCSSPGPASAINRLASAVIGQGLNSTYLVPTPTFNYAAAVAAGTVFCANCLLIDSLSIYGLDNNNPTVPGSFNIFSLPLNSVIKNVNLLGWLANPGGGQTIVGLTMAGITSYAINFQDDGGGNKGCAFPSTFNTIIASFCGDLAGPALQGSYTGTNYGGVYSAGNTYGGGNGGGPTVDCQGDCTFSGDIMYGVGIGGLGGGNDSFRCSGTCMITGGRIDQFSTSTGVRAIHVVSGAVLSIDNSKVLCTSATSTCVVVDSGGTLIDNCGNIFTATGGATLAIINGTVKGPCATASGNPYAASTNCASSTSPAVCGFAKAGSITVTAAATSVTVNTTAVAANSNIIVTFDASLGTKLGVTCNTTVPSLYGVSARVPGTSFTLTSTAPLTNPACFNYFIDNSNS